MQITSVLDGDLGLTGDEKTGVSIVRKALDEPLRWIAQNAGQDGYVVVQKVRGKEWGVGLDAATGEYVDLAKAGIIDPVKVTRNAVSNAASIAALLLTTESLVVEKPEQAAAGRRRRPRPRPRPPARPGLLTRQHYCTDPRGSSQRGPRGSFFVLTSPPVRYRVRGSRARLGPW